MSYLAEVFDRIFRPQEESKKLKKKVVERRPATRGVDPDLGVAQASTLQVSDVSGYSCSSYSPDPGYKASKATGSTRHEPTYDSTPVEQPRDCGYLSSSGSSSSGSSD